MIVRRVNIGDDEDEEKTEPLFGVDDRQDHG